MAIWQTPKTDWANTDFFNIEDYNRIVGNIIYIKFMAEKLFEQLDLYNMVEKKQYISKIYASDINAIEQNVRIINADTYRLDIGDTKTYTSNGNVINYVELNRIENAIDNLCRTISGNLATLQHLSITLSRTQFGKRVQYCDTEPMFKRFDFRLGTLKGVI